MEITTNDKQIEKSLLAFSCEDLIELTSYLIPIFFLVCTNNMFTKMFTKMFSFKFDYVLVKINLNTA